MRTQDEALAYPRGRIDLHHCTDCGFIFNAAFEPELQEYSERYEETQGFSATFQDFHRLLAERLIERWDIRGKRVLEIGCGKGEFLALLCELGGNEGVGFDPAFVPQRSPPMRNVELRFHREMYPPSSGSAVLESPPDFVCCKMTLEHIADVGGFIRDIRRSLPADPAPVVFFQVPNADRIFRDAAFWDIYYEHCSYFTRESLVRLFGTCGFNVVEAWTDYEDQYLMLTAVPSHGGDPDAGRGPRSEAEAVSVFAHDVRTFAKRVTSDAESWRDRLRAEREKGGLVCIWGGGSKAVAFLSVVGGDLVSYAVDINPHRQGTYLPGSGLEIVGPQELRRRTPSMVIAMNPIYLNEIAEDLRAVEVVAELLTVG